MATFVVWISTRYYVFLSDESSEILSEAIWLACELSEILSMHEIDSSLTEDVSLTYGVPPPKAGWSSFT